MNSVTSKKSNFFMVTATLWCSGQHTRFANESYRVRLLARVVTLGKFLYTNCLFDPALIGYLDVRRLASRILGTWGRCGVVDKVSYFKAPLNFVNYSQPTCFKCISKQGVGGLEGHIGLPALQPSTLSL